MGDSVDRMYEMSLFGYAYGQHIYPFFSNGIAVWVILTLMAVAMGWRIYTVLLDGDESAVVATLLGLVGSGIVLVMLFQPTTFPLSEKAPLTPYMLQKKRELFGTEQGAMPYVADKVDRFMDAWVQFAILVSKRENRFLMPGTAQSAAQNLSRSDALADPQTRSILSQWQQTIVPALLQNASFAEKIKSENLMGYLLYPVTTAADVKVPELVDKARRVRDLLNNEPGLDLVGMVRTLSGALNDSGSRLGGTAMAVNADGTAVQADLLGPYTINAKVADVLPPADYTATAGKAYEAGHRALSSVANDSSRQPLSSYRTFGELYERMGLATDVALARNQLQSAEGVLGFGLTCLNQGEDYCKQSFSLAPTNMASTESGWDLGNRLLRFGNAVASTPGAAMDHAGMEIAKVKIPLYIGAAKGIVAVVTPIFLLVMLWPGRFLQGLTLMLGCQIVVGLWMCLYIIWTWLVSDFLFGSSAGAAVGSVLGLHNALGSYPVMVDVLLVGYGVLGALSWMVVFGGLDKAHRSFAVGKGGATGGLNSLQKSLKPAAAIAKPVMAKLGKFTPP